MNFAQLSSKYRFNRLAAACLCAFAVSACDKTAAPEQLISDARAAIERNDFQTASIQLKNALQQDANNGAARFELGRIYQRFGDSASAASEFKRAFDLGYSPGEVVPQLVRAMVESGKAEDALTAFSSVPMPDVAAEANLQAALGYARMAIGNVEGAARAFDEALAKAPDHTYALIGKARLFGTQRQYKEAHALLDKVLQSGRADVDAWFLDAELKAVQGQFEPSMTSYRKVYELQPENVRARFIVVSALANEGRLKDARSELAALRKVAPKSPDSNYLDGLLLVKERKFPEAREKLGKILAVAPAYTPALGLAALTEFELKSFATAEQFAEKAIANGGDSFFMRKILIGSYLRTGRVAKAKQALAPLLKNEPTNPDVQSLAGQVYLVSGDASAAESAFALAVKQKPDDAAAQSRLGLSRLAAGDREGGVRSLESAARIDADDGRADVILIVAHLRNRDADRALAAIDVFEKKKPDDPMVSNLRGTAYLLKNDVERARASFSRALEIEPTFFPAASNLARIDLISDKAADAEGRFRAILEKAPQHPDALMSLAGLRARSSDGVAEATSLLQKAISGNPKLAAPRLALIDLLSSRGDSKQALTVASDAATALPDDVAVLESLALAQAAAGKLDEAVASRNKLVERDSTNTQHLLKLAAVLMVAKRESEAIQTVRKALSIKPDLLDAQNMLITIHRNRNDLGEALRVTRDVQKQRPKEAIGYVMEGELQMYAGKFDAAADSYREAIARERNAIGVTRLHAALERQGKARDAKALVDGWMKEFPKDNAVPMYLADAALSQKRYDDARSAYEGVLVKLPKNPVVLNNLAWLAAQNKDPKARDYAARAHEIAPRSPAVLDTYGSILVDAGEVDRGLQMMRDAVAGAPEVRDLRFNLAQALARSGRKADARKELEPLVDLGSRYERAAEVAELMKTL